MDNASPTPIRGRSFFRSSIPALSLEPLERKLGWFVSSLMVIMTIAAAFWTTSLQRVKTSHHRCHAGFTLVSQVCERYVRADPTTRLISASVVAAIALASFYFVYRRRRSGVIFASLFMFLTMNWATSSIYAGLVFLFFAAWLFIRRNNHVRYGTTSPTAEQRRAARAASASSRGAARRPANSAESTRRAPAPSKRYTPPKK
jgi:hypothetical protein